MYYMNIFLAIIFLSSGLLNNGHKTKSNFELILTSDKSVYQEGENIYLNITIKNNGSSVSINNPFESIRNNMIIENEYGLHPQLVNKLFTDSKISFSSGETKSEEVDLLYNYGYKLNNKSTSQYFMYFPSGKYIIKCKIDIGDNDIVESNEINVTVVPPNESEISAFFEMKYIDSFYINVNKLEKRVMTKEENESAIDRMIIFLGKYPKSIYTNRILIQSNIVRSMFNYKYDSSFVNDNKNFLLNQPDSKDLQIFIRSISSFFKRTDGNYKNAIIYYETLEISKSNNRIQSLISDELTRIRKLK